MTTLPSEEKGEAPSVPPAQSVVEKKPKDDWKKLQELKKLKKQQDRDNEKNKLHEGDKTKHTQESKEHKSIKQSKPSNTKHEHTVQISKEQPKDQPLQPPIQPLDQPQPPIQPTPRHTSIQKVLPSRKYQFRTRQEDVTHLLLSYTSQLITQDDSTLLASTHSVIKQWSNTNIGEVIDIWGLTSTSSRRQNIIRTRLQDVSYFVHSMSKVLCGASAVFQNGVVMSSPGTLLIATLSLQFGIPLIVVAPSHKYYDFPIFEGDYSEYEGVLYDILPAKYVSLIVTEAGPINAGSIQTLFKQLNPLKSDIPK